MLALTVVVALHVVLGEMVPKNIALAGPERAAIAMGPPLLFIVQVLRPVIVGLNAVANATLRLLRVEPKDEISSSFTREEVAALVEESRGEGLIEKGEYERLSGALGFTEKTVDSVTLSAEGLTTVPDGATGAEVEALCASTGYSRFPVADPDGDLRGYLHIKDVLEPDEQRRQQRIDQQWIRPFARVDAHESLPGALETLQRRGAHMARVVDPDTGVTVGIATLEDMVEELVGEIRDAVHLDEPSASTPS